VVGFFHTAPVNPVPPAYARGILSFDLPVRQVHGPEAFDGWFGVKRETSDYGVSRKENYILAA